VGGRGQTMSGIGLHALTRAHALAALQAWRERALSQTSMVYFRRSLKGLLLPPNRYAAANAY